MANHRIRLNDEEVEMIVSALNARLAMVKAPGKRAKMQLLAERLADGGVGNPRLRFLAGEEVEAKCKRCGATLGKREDGSLRGCLFC